jgi:NTP pyrophosphatase (non-canonical NTP hydrolase)
MRRINIYTSEHGIKVLKEATHQEIKRNSIKKNKMEIIKIDEVPVETVLSQEPVKRTDDVLQMIKHWSYVFNEPVEPVLTRPSDHRIKLSNELIREEYKEFTDEIFRDPLNLIPKDNINFSEVADSLGDTLWVVARAMYTYGIDPLKVIRKIYDSNMSKLCKTEAEAQLTVDCYADGTHLDKPGVEIETYFQPQEDYYLVYRQVDGKVLKSINFKAPDFSDL